MLLLSLYVRVSRIAQDFAIFADDSYPDLVCRALDAECDLEIIDHVMELKIDCACS